MILLLLVGAVFLVACGSDATTTPSVLGDEVRFRGAMVTGHRTDESLPILERAWLRTATRYGIGPDFDQSSRGSVRVHWAIHLTARESEIPCPFGPCTGLVSGSHIWASWEHGAMILEEALAHEFCHYFDWALRANLGCHIGVPA